MAYIDLTLLIRSLEKSCMVCGIGGGEREREK